MTVSDDDMRQFWGLYTAPRTGITAFCKDRMA